MIAISFMGCKFLPIRRVKPDLNDVVEDGFLVLAHVQAGTGPEREKVLSGLLKASKTTWQRDHCLFHKYFGF